MIGTVTLILVLVCAAAATAFLAAPGAEEDNVVRLDFETGDLSQFDAVERAAADRLRVVRDPTREGSYAARFEVRDGDFQEATTGVRAELIAEHDDARQARAGDERWYRWWTLFRRDYPTVDLWQTFVQWKSDSAGSPPLAMTVQRDEIRLSGGEQDDFHIYWRAPLEPGRWHGFVAHIRWSPDRDGGLVELWHDGRRVLPPIQTATMYRGADGRPIPNYLKIGLYRHSDIEPTQVLFHDGLRVGSTRSALGPDGRG